MKSGTEQELASSRVLHITPGTLVDGVKEEVVLSPPHALSLIAAGEEHRHVGSTNYNLLSSRSHTIFTLLVSEGRKKVEHFELYLRVIEILLTAVFIATLIFLHKVCDLTSRDVFTSLVAVLPTGWGLLQIAQIYKVQLIHCRVWWFARELARVYDYLMGALQLCIALPAWFSIFSKFQTRILFNEAFSRGLHIRRVLAGGKK